MKKLLILLLCIGALVVLPECRDRCCRTSCASTCDYSCDTSCPDQCGDRCDYGCGDGYYGGDNVYNQVAATPGYIEKKGARTSRKAMMME